MGRRATAKEKARRTTRRAESHTPAVRTSQSNVSCDRHRETRHAQVTYRLACALE
jgi:hypothetical protein